MEALGIVLWFMALWAWFMPERFGRWIGTIIAHARTVQTPNNDQER